MILALISVFLSLSSWSSVHSATSMIRVFTLNTDFVKSGLDTNNQQCIVPATFTPRSLPKQITFCVRFRIDVNVNDYGNSANPVLLEMGYRKEGDTLLTEGFSYSVFRNVPWVGLLNEDSEGQWSWVGAPNLGGQYDLWVWHHHCIALDWQTGRLQIYQDGLKIENKVHDTLVQDFGSKWKEPINAVAVGCFQWAIGNGETTIGKMADFQIFSKILSDQQMKDITGCKSFPEGDFLSSKTRAWRLDGRFKDVKDVNIEDVICNKDEETFIHIPVTDIFDEDRTIHTCRKYSGELVSYADKDDFNKITKAVSKLVNDVKYVKDSPCAKLGSEEIQKHPLDTESTWYIDAFMAITDEEVEGDFVNWFTDEKVEYLPWRLNRPYSGGTDYNCLVTRVKVQDNMRIYHSEVMDDTCKLELCPLCSVQRPAPRLRMRGLCLGSLLDTTYYYSLAMDGEIRYKGTEKSVIYYDKLQKSWIWTRWDNNDTFVQSKSSRDSLFVGLNKVDFSNFKDKCSSGPENQVAVKMTSCEADQFTCNDGQCVEMDERCDQITNCLDKSDEIDCGMILFEENYNKKTPPFIFDKKTGETFPCKVNASFVVKKLLDISEVNLEFEMKFVLSMEWFDHRLTFHNIKEKSSQNALTESESESVWIPYAVFTTTKQNEATSFEKGAKVTISRKGNFTRSAASEIHEINIFKGMENSVQFEKSYTKMFRCEYALNLYPFDTQKCFVVLSVPEYEQKIVNLIPMTVSMEENLDLTKYVIMDWKINYHNSREPSQGISVRIVLNRRLLSELLNTYLPTIFLVVIAHLTNYFKDFFFEAVVTVNLTAMLVLATMFVSVSSSLPRTAYIKMIDIWLIFSMLIPFCEVLLHTYMESLRDNKTEEKEEKEVEISLERVGSSSSQGSYVKVPKKILPGSKVDHADLIAKNESDMVNARRDFYNNVQSSNEKRLKRCKFIGLKVMPGLIAVFNLVYWTYGLFCYFDTTC